MPIERIPDDYESGGEFETFEPGKYRVKGITFFTLDDDEAPIFIAQSGQRLTARYRTELADGDEGPPGSVDRGQLPLLVRAFGADPKLLPPYNQPNARLVMAERIINEADKTVVVDVNDSGWISNVSGMEIPPGYYRTVFRGVATTNEIGEPAWIDGQYGKFAVVIMEIVGDSVGNSTPWDRVRMREYLNYALETIDGELCWTRNKSGGWSGAAVNMHTFLVAVCGPDILSASFDNVENIMPEVDAEGQRLSRVCNCTVEKSTRGRKRTTLRLGSLFVAPEVSTPTTPARSTTPADPLYDALNEQFEGKAFDEDGGLTAEAKEWVGSLVGTDPTDGEEVTGLRALARKHKIPGKFAKMTGEQVNIILQWMGKEVSDDAAEAEDEDEF